MNFLINKNPFKILSSLNNKIFDLSVKNVKIFYFLILEESYG